MFFTVIKNILKISANSTLVILTLLLGCVANVSLAVEQAQNFSTNRIFTVSVVKNENSSFAIIRDNEGNRYALSIGDTFEYQGSSYSIHEISATNIILKNSFGVEINVRPTENDLVQSKNQKPKSAARKRKNVNLRIPDIDAIEIAKQRIARRIDDFAPLVGDLVRGKEFQFSRNFAGRPGILIEDFATALQFEGIALEKGDIVLSINGIPANDLDSIEELAGRLQNEYFVEYERNGKLAMMKVTIK